MYGPQFMRRRRQNKAAFLYTPGVSLASLGATFSRASTATYVDQNGIVQTASSGTARDGHYINGVQSLLLEGQRTNSLLWCSDMTNAAWTKRGTISVLKTATGPDGIANSATTVVGCGASGVNDVFQALTGLSISSRYEPGFWIKKVTASGTLNLATTTGAGNWNINFALLPTGWVWLTRSHAAVSISVEFASNASGQAGPWFSVASGTLDFNYALGNFELGTFPSSAIPTTTVAVTRSADSLSFPFAYNPAAMTVYAKIVELGTKQLGLRTLFIGSTSGTNPRLEISSNTANYGLQHHNGTANVSSVGGAPALNDVAEFRGVLLDTGAVRFGCSINGAAETVAGDSAANTLAAAWSGQVLTLNQWPAFQAPGFAAFQSVKIALGVQSLATIRGL